MSEAPRWEIEESGGGWAGIEWYLLAPSGNRYGLFERVDADAVLALQAEADAAIRVAKMMLAQVEGRFMIEGSSVDAETAHGYFMGLLDNDILVSELRHEADALRQRLESADGLWTAMGQILIGEEGCRVCGHPWSQHAWPTTTCRGCWRTCGVEMAKEAAALRGKVAVLTEKQRGTYRTRILWIWEQMHKREEEWADRANYFGGESIRTSEQAFFEAYDALVALAPQPHPKETT